MIKKGRKLLEQVRDVIRLRHYSILTEDSYAGWIKRFILFHDKQHPKEMGTPEIEAFLTHLAVSEKVASSTQNQAFNAILFLYKHVLKIELDKPINSIRAKKPRHLPSVLTQAEVLKIISAISGTHQLMAKLIYGTGLRLMECIRLRVKDLDFEKNSIIVRDAKGMQDRITMLPESVKSALQEHLQKVKLSMNMI